MHTPIAFIIFKRADLTERVFAEIRRAKPVKLYIIADGPRTPEEQADTDAARAVTEGVDWPCKVVRLYSSANLGCKKRVITGLNEVFAREEQVIILEDDCLPHPTFFTYCATLLHQYRDDTAIGTINGTAMPGLTAIAGEKPCVFTRFSVVWGWATTRRVWQLVDPEIEEWESLRQTDWLKSLFPGQPHLVYGVGAMFDQTRAGCDAWSYAMLFALLKHNLLNVHPAENLISNIGFDHRAAHTYTVKPYSNLPYGRGWAPHPPLKPVNNPQADILIFETLYYWHLKKKTLAQQWKRKAWLALYGLKQKLLPGISLKKVFTGQ